MSSAPYAALIMLAAGVGVPVLAALNAALQLDPTSRGLVKKRHFCAIFI